MRRKARQIITILCALSLFLGCGAGFNFILVDDAPDPKSFMATARLMFHDMYTSKHNIDIAFVGSSHAYVSFVPKIVDEKFGAYSFNAATATQYMDGSFAVIQELCEYHKPRRIFLEMYFAMANGPEYMERKDLSHTYAISDYMRPSLRKLRYLWNAGNKSHWVNNFFPARRNWRKIFDLNFISSTIKRKRSIEYRNYHWWDRKEGDEFYYVERGFVALDKTWKDLWSSWAHGAIGKAVQLNETNDWYKSLVEIINYCREHEIELALIVAPMPEITIVGAEKYQLYHDFIQDIADRHGLLFADFNYCRPEYFDTNDRNMFWDNNHVNIKGAEMFTNIFCDFINGKIAKEKLFFDTLQDKLDAEEPTVLGFAGPTKDGKGYVISNRENGMEFKLVATPKDGMPRVIQDFSKEKEFAIPEGEHGKLVLLWRMKEKAGRIETKY